MDEASVRYTNAVLIDDEQRTHIGDFLLHMDGTWSESKGDEDVVHNIDGSKRLITRSFQNWHTHLPMQLNACLLYTSPSPRDMRRSRMPSSA